MLSGLNGAQATLNALGHSLAIIEFDPTGRILTANENFCRVIGYELAEIVGKHHSIFVDGEYRNSAHYRDFWPNLSRGQHDTGEHKRIGKGGREIWLQASYSPVKGASGKVTKVVKIAMDVTAERMRNAEFESKMNAVSRVQATIEFLPSGEILTANDNFLAALGYRLQELSGQHHRMLCEPAYANSPDYQEHWRRLNQGEFVAAEFKRIGKDGKPVWIQASYNPIFDFNGKVFKVIKFATVISDRVEAVNDIAEGLSRLASNDLTHEIRGTFAPAFEQLRVDFNRSIQTLRATMRDVITAATNIETGAQEISTAADELSHRTESQAANLEETAAALDQITGTVKTAASGAEQARLVVLTADEDAKGSATIVNSAVEAMGGIAQSSQKISQIIGVIDEIAFQTNLLALNAGVEAARAGEAGRGFAVVASEVRALAQRSAEAAKEIKALIRASSAQVDNGVKLVGDTGDSLKRIMSEVGEISGVVQTIAAGAKDQANGLAEINTAVTQMDRATQQNAAMVEESTAACRLLTEEAVHLAALVRQFRLDETGRREETRASYAETRSRAA